MIKKVIWRGSYFNPFTLLLPEQTPKIVEQETWMLRIIDVPSALSKRGYPKKLEAELHLDVRDDLINANNGKFCLKVSQGQGEVSQGGKGNFQLDIRSLASVYTGFSRILSNDELFQHRAGGRNQSAKIHYAG